MPRKYKPFDVTKVTTARERIDRGGFIEYGPVGAPPDHLGDDQRVAWLDLTDAAAPGILAPSDRMHVEITAYWVAKARRGELNKTCTKEMRKCLRSMFLTPSAVPTPAAILDAFKSSGPRN